MEEKRVLNSIKNWLNCNDEVAKNIYNGVYLWNNDYYSAFVTKDDKIQINKNGFAIHLITTI